MARHSKPVAVVVVGGDQDTQSNLTHLALKLDLLLVAVRHVPLCQPRLASVGLGWVVGQLRCVDDHAERGPAEGLLR